MINREITRTLVICLVFSGSTLAQQRKVYKPTWKSLDQHTTSGWFRDAKLGLFIYGPGCTKEEWERYNARYGGRRGVARHLGAKYTKHDATVLHQLGMDHNTLTYNHHGRDETLTDSPVSNPRVVRELLDE